MKITKDEVIKRARELWLQFGNMSTDVTYEEFIKSALEEWEKQSKMEEKELKEYRDKKYKDLVRNVKRKNEAFNKEMDIKENKKENKK